MKLYALLLPLFFWAGLAFSQQQSNYRSLKVSVENDTVQLDTLSIIPGTFEAFLPNKDSLDTTLYFMNYPEALLIGSLELKEITDSILISFRVFPLKFTKSYSYLEPNSYSIDPLIKKAASQNSGRSLYNPSGSSLYTSGNLSRGVQIGNNQDASLNSNLNLQLSGKISPQFNIEAQLSDASIPIQPEGNTQQLQEFDRLYIKLYNQNTELLAGDFTLTQSEGYFQKMNKNLQGIQLKTSFSGTKNDENRFTTRTTGAIVKGKFNRMNIRGVEGNQGPYKLTGLQGEQYIQVIAGSEKVYIDGLPIERGENQGYTINYNSAEISFTTNILITKDKRITVQFEYTERSYARFVISSDNEWKTKNGLIYLNIYNESDARNQPLLQDLSIDQKEFLSGIGDQLDKAYVANFYETEFQNDRVLYKLVDTLVQGQSYNQILLYSTNPDSARYQAGFSNVGENNGNYIPVRTSANGQVYKWVAPINGIPQGSFEPITRLVTPKKKQIYSLGTVTNLSEKMILNAELSLSSNDLNSFSDMDRDDNQGTGLLARLDRSDVLKKDSSLILKSFVLYRRTGKQFNALEPFRSVEFERDWNLNQKLPANTEHLAQGGFHLINKDSLFAGYTLDWLNYSNEYSGTKHNTQGQWYANTLSLKWDASLLQSKDSFRNTGFLRHNLELKKDWSILSITLIERQEGNSWKDKNDESIIDGSYKFQEWEALVSGAENGKIPWFAKVLVRTDYFPDNSDYSKDYQALESSTGFQINGKNGNSSKLSANWRKLESLNENTTNPDDESTATIRAEEQFQILKGALVSRTFYEIGSGLERKQDFYYLEVPQGQGYYTWEDYNGNNIKELDEFEPAVFADQANYIRVIKPGSNYVPVYTNRFTQTISFNPGRFVRSPESKAKFLRLINNQFSFNGNRKNSRSDFLNTMNPFSIEDSLVVSLQNQIRNKLSFNGVNRKVGVDYIIEEAAHQNLMTYGTDYRKTNSHNLLLRWRIIDPLMVNNRIETGSQEFRSSFFIQRNYHLNFIRNTLSASLESTDQTRISLEWNWSHEVNASGSEILLQQKIELGGDYQSPGKGLLHLDISYINLNFNGLPDTPVGYVMLKGLRPGHNGLANLTFRRKLSEVIQLDLSYGLRLSQNSSVIHTGNIAVRAVF